MIAAALLAVVTWVSPSPAGQTGAYSIGPLDVVSISVLEQPALTGRYSIETDGTFVFPLIGRLKGAGLTPRELEVEIAGKLSNGYIKKPQVTVGVETYRSQRIFMVGEIRSPGTYPLSGGMTLIEALARAGSASSGASGEALIVRPTPEQAVTGATLPAQSAANVIRVDIQALQSGDLTQNLLLQDGDTIFLPRAETVYVFGLVARPGAYTIQKDTTVLQALSLAGGVAPRGALGRIKIVRLVDGKKKEIRVKLNDVVRPGDTIIVPERFF